jgi:DNA-directed RNA polymerase subunit omega
MHRVNVDELFEGKQSKYALVVGVSKRARQITEKFEKENTVTDKKPVLLAIEEIRNHEVNLIEPEDDEL